MPAPLPVLLTEGQNALQMPDLPSGSGGLDWIMRQAPLGGQGGSSVLLLVPGLQAASIAAAAAGSPDAFVHLHSAAQQCAASGATDCSKFDRFCLAASKVCNFGRNLKLFLEYHPDAEQFGQAFQQRMDFTVHCLHAAVLEGQLEALKWLRALCHRLLDFDDDLLKVAARQGHLSILKYLRSGPDAAPWNEGIAAAAAPHIDCLLWLLSQEPACPCPADIVYRVAQQADLNAIRTLREASKVPLISWHTVDICIAAARCNDLAMLQYVRGLVPPVPWDSVPCHLAVLHDNLSMLQWLRSEGCPWDERCMASAAGAGNLRLLQWMRAQKPPCPWGVSVSAAAARQPDLCILQWLRGQRRPCPMDPACARHAARRGDLQMLQWLRLQGQPCSWNGSLYYDAAASGSHDTLKWIHAQDIPPPPECRGELGYVPEGSLRSASIPMLMILSDIGVPLPPKQQARLQAARRAFCTFHGLVCWGRHALSDTDSGYHPAFRQPLARTSGQHLLVGLSMLPLELLNRIAIAAELQHEPCDAHSRLMPYPH